MLAEIYIEALIADQDAADEVWEEWNKGEISTYWAACGWWEIAM